MLKSCILSQDMWKCYIMVVQHCVAPVFNIASVAEEDGCDTQKSMAVLCHKCTQSSLLVGCIPSAMQFLNLSL